MNFLVVGDLHGNKPKILAKDFDAIITTGDFCSDKHLNPLYKAWFGYLKKEKESQLSFSEFVVDMIGKKRLRELETESLKGGRKVLEFLNSFGVPVYIVPGNWDQSYGKTKIKNSDASDYNYIKSFLDYYLADKTNPYLTRGLRNIKDCQFKLHKIKEYNIIGYGLSSGPEYYAKKLKKRKFSKSESLKLRNAYQKIMNKLAEKCSKNNGKITVFLTHNVPYGMKLDVGLDKNSYAYKKHLGSSIARDFCKRYKPLVCIGGHIHEHFGKCILGKTTVINAGYGFKGNVILELNDSKIKRLKFVK